MNTLVTVPEAELRTALTFLAGADKILSPALALVPGYPEATQAHGVLSLLLRDAADGMPPDPVQGIDAMAAAHHEIFESYQRQFGDEDFAKAATLEYVRALAITIAANSTTA